MDPIFGLFVQLHWLVSYAVMIGLLLASIWVWAIVIDKLILFNRTRKAHGPVRAGLLVGAIAGGALPLAFVAAEHVDGGAVCRSHA